MSIALLSTTDNNFYQGRRYKNNDFIRFDIPVSYQTRTMEYSNVINGEIIYGIFNCDNN